MIRRNYNVTKQRYNLSEKESKLTQSGGIDWSRLVINKKTGKADGWDSCDGDHAALSFTFEDAAELGFSSKQFSGLVSSLTQKGVIELEEWHGVDGIEKFYWLKPDFIASIAEENSYIYFLPHQH